MAKPMHATGDHVALIRAMTKTADEMGYTEGGFAVVCACVAGLSGPGNVSKKALLQALKANYEVVERAKLQRAKGGN